MATKCGFAVLLVTSVGLAITGTVEAQTHTTTFTQSTPIVVPAGAPGNTSGTAAPYPSSITVSGLSGVTYHVSVRLNITHTFPADLNVLLVGPGSYPAVMLVSDVGNDVDWFNTTIVLDDCAPRALRTNGVPAGRYRPTNEGLGNPLPASAPAAPYANTLSAFNWRDPNGTWSLYVFDDGSGDVGTINNWSLTIFDQPASPLPSQLNPVSCSAPDYDGDGRADVGVFRRATGEWFISRSGASGASFQLNWGAPASSGLGDTDVPADYDGDGVTDVAIYRQATGEWFIRKSSDSSLQQVSFGAPASLGLGDTPIPSDYDGDGLADIAIFRASTAQWFLRSSAGLGVRSFIFGSAPAGDNPAR
jgi:subtilisin-like proprotein convertase family protein